MVLLNPTRNANSQMCAEKKLPRSVAGEDVQSNEEPLDDQSSFSGKAIVC